MAEQIAQRWKIAAGIAAALLVALIASAPWSVAGSYADDARPAVERTEAALTEALEALERKSFKRFDPVQRDGPHLTKIRGLNRARGASFKREERDYRRASAAIKEAREVLAAESGPLTDVGGFPPLNRIGKAADARDAAATGAELIDAAGAFLADYEALTSYLTAVQKVDRERSEDSESGKIPDLAGKGLKGFRDFLRGRLRREERFAERYREIDPPRDAEKIHETVLEAQQIRVERAQQSVDGISLAINGKLKDGIIAGEGALSNTGSEVPGGYEGVRVRFGRHFSDLQKNSVLALNRDELIELIESMNTKLAEL